MKPEQREKLKQSAMKVNPDDLGTSIQYRQFAAWATPSAILSLIAQVEALTVPQWTNQTQVLHPKEANFVLLVTECPNTNLDYGTNDWADDDTNIGGFWKKPEELGLIECTGSWCWKPSTSLSLAVHAAKLKAVIDFANSFAPTIPAIPGTREGE